MRQLDTLRPACGPARIDQRQDRIWIVAGVRAEPIATHQSVAVEDYVPGEGRIRLGQGRVSNNPARARVGQHIINLGDGKTDVDGNGNHAEPTARINEFDIFGRVGKQDGEAISLLETGTAQSGSESMHAIMKLGKSE